MASLSQEDLNDLPPAGVSYERHRPERTLLYQIIKEHWPRFQEHLERRALFHDLGSAPEARIRH